MAAVMRRTSAGFSAAAMLRSLVEAPLPRNRPPRPRGYYLPRLPIVSRSKVISGATSSASNPHSSITLLT